MRKLFFELRNNEDGASDVITGVILFAIIFMLLSTFSFGGWSYFTAASENTNLNYNVGRYVSSLDMCDTSDSSLGSMKYLTRYNDYDIEAYFDGSATPTVIQDVANQEGTISISCDSTSWNRGAEFSVNTVMGLTPIQFYDVFPESVAKGSIYVVETSKDEDDD